MLQRQLCFPSSRLCDTNLRTRQRGALPFTSGRTLPSLFTLRLSGVMKFGPFQAHTCFSGPDVSVSSAPPLDIGAHAVIVASPCFLVTAARRTHKSNEPCYDWANYTRMINMQSRNRCKVLLVQTYVGGQEDVWLMLTSLDEAEDLEVRSGALRWSHSLLCIYLQHHPLFSACVQTFLYLNREFVYMQGNRKWSSGSDACRLCSFKSVIPISSIWGASAFAACSFSTVVLLLCCRSPGCIFSFTVLRPRWLTFSTMRAKSALVTDYCLIPFASCWLRIKRQLS